MTTFNIVEFILFYGCGWSSEFFLLIESFSVHESRVYGQIG